MNKVKLYVPIMDSTLNEQTREKYLESLNKMGADTVFIAAHRDVELYFQDERHEEALKHLKENIEYFEANGYSVGVWTTSFGFGSEYTDEIKEAMKGCSKIVSVTGNVLDDALCPENEFFIKKHCKMIEDFVKLGAKMIMLDDDMCLSVRPGIGCFCDTHKKMMEEIAGEKFPENPKDVFFSGKTNKWRKAWHTAIKNSMIKFCENVRKTVDGVDSSVRLGFCAGYTSWDIECADALELTYVLAGKTKPFLRLTGAPYWFTKARFRSQKLHSIIDLTRMQDYWLEGEDVEFFVEDDTYPRPRYHTSAALCESFDLLTRTSGRAGCLKYMLDYRSSHNYEKGYEKAHIRNKELRQFIDENFQDKKDFGICVYEPMRKIKDMELPKPFVSELDVMNTAFSNASAMVSLQGLPLYYGKNKECMVAFGEAVRDLISDMPKKLVTDYIGAKILAENGIDVGIKECKRAGLPVSEEYENEIIGFFCPTGDFYDLTVSNDAKVESYFKDTKSNKYIGSYTYNNEENEFLIFSFNGYTVLQGNDIFLSYKRQEQLLSFCGNYPHIKNEPYIYTILKKNEKQTALLIANLGEDSLYDAEINLDKEYSGIKIFGAKGELLKDKIIINGRISSYDIIPIILED